MPPTLARPGPHPARGRAFGGMNRSETLTHALHCAAAHTQAAQSHDQPTAELARRLAADAEAMYTTVGVASEDGPTAAQATLAGMLAEVVAREVAREGAALRADLESDYRARVAGLRAAVGRTLSQWDGSKA